MCPDSGGAVKTVRHRTVLAARRRLRWLSPTRLELPPMRALTLLLVLAIGACATSPLGRRQIMLAAPGEMDEMGVAAFTDMKKKMPESKDAKATAYVGCVARNVTSVM